MNVYEKLATKIRKLRQKKGWSQEELHRTYISHIECGKRQISVETMCRIAKGFGIPPAELMEGVSL